MSPLLRKQWGKLASTRKPRKRTNTASLIKSKPKDDVVPIIDAWVKGKKVSRVYVDGGAQMCVMTERLMNRLKLEITTPSKYRVSLANNANINCLGVIEDLMIKVCDIQVQVDMYVIQSKGEGYPIILGRPSLIAMNADKKWGTRTFFLKHEKAKGVNS